MMVTQREYLIEKLSDEMDPDNARDVVYHAIAEGMAGFAKDLRRLVDEWRDVAKRPSHPAGYAACAEQLEQYIASRVGVRR